MSGLRCLFASDLHGRTDRYRKLLGAIREERPKGDQGLAVAGGQLTNYHLKTEIGFAGLLEQGFSFRYIPFIHDTGSFGFFLGQGTNCRRCHGGRVNRNR